MRLEMGTGRKNGIQINAGSVGKAGGADSGFVQARNHRRA